jgi:alpha-1,2-mannosyltransferase
MSVLLVVVSAWLVTRRLHNRGDRLGALVVVATVPLLISPVSWSHHWVWALPGLLWAATSIGRRALTVPLALVAAVFCYGPHWWYPPLALAGQRWVGWYNILGNAYVWITCALLGVLVVTTARSPERRCPRRDDEGGAGRPVVTSGTAR